MCLYVKNPQPPAPTEVKHFYKVVHREGQKSLYMDTPYMPGTTVVAEADPNTDFEDAQAARNVGADEGVYDSGVLHFYTSLAVAEEAADCYICELCGGETAELDVIMVKCHPEHFIAWGFGQDVCYTECEVLD